MTATTSTGDQATRLSVSKRFQVVRTSGPIFSIRGHYAIAGLSCGVTLRHRNKPLNTPRLAVPTSIDV
jgi:hypothetical protein